jgi:endonuclease/exonuclease/phosphatase family metal-dependent hydrolase
MKWLKRIVVLLLFIALFVVYVRHDGIQYTMALVLRSWSKPYFNVETYRARPNCDAATPCETGKLKVMTYNVLCRVCEKDGYDKWDVRWPHLKDLMAKYDADLLGLQELGGYGDIDTILKAFPQYAYETYKFGPWAFGDCALFYRADRFDVLDAGQMWLSPKPALPFAHNWKPLSVPRYVNWAYLRQKNNGFRFLFVNTHFDNNGINKENAAEMFSRTFRPVAESIPIIATGDFNTGPRDEKRYKKILGLLDGPAVFKDTMDLAARNLCTQIPSGATEEDTQYHTNLTWTIDHILIAGPVDIEVAHWTQDSSGYEPLQRWPSDHPAVYSEFNLRTR